MKLGFELEICLALKPVSCQGGLAAVFCLSEQCLGFLYCFVFFASGYCQTTLNSFFTWLNVFHKLLKLHLYLICIASFNNDVLADILMD